MNTRHIPRFAALLVPLLTLLLLPTAHAAADARAQLHAFADSLKTVSADFSQQTVNGDGRPGPASNGTLQLAAPRLFRWQVLAPDHQLIVADGTRVWIYDPDLEQVTVRRQSSAEAHSPLNVLTDLKLLDAQFKVVADGSHDGAQWLRLLPRTKDAQFKYALLGFSDDTLQTMVFEDLLGDRTTIRFSHWRRNPALPADTFRFTPPPGADVIGDVPTTEAYPLKN